MTAGDGTHHDVGVKEVWYDTLMSWSGEHLKGKASAIAQRGLLMALHPNLDNDRLYNELSRIRLHIDWGQANAGA